MCKIDGSKQIRAGNIWNIFEAIEHMEVSIFRGSCFINHPFGGIQIYGHLHIYIYIYTYTSKGTTGNGAFPEASVKPSAVSTSSSSSQASSPVAAVLQVLHVVHLAQYPSRIHMYKDIYIYIFEKKKYIYIHNILMIVRIKILYMYIHPYYILDLSQAYTK